MLLWGLFEETITILKFIWGLSFPGCAALRTKTTLSRPKLFGHQEDMEGIRLRRREADGPIPQIPAVWADVFGSFVRRRVGEIRCPKIVGLLGRHTSSGR